MTAMPDMNPFPLDDRTIPPEPTSPLVVLFFRLIAMLACFALGWWCMGLVNKKNTASAENSPPVVTQPQLQQAATRPKPASRSSVVTINAPVPPDPDATPEPPVVVDLPLPRSTGQRCPVPQEVMDETPDTTRRARDIYERNAKALLTLSK